MSHQSIFAESNKILRCLFTFSNEYIICPNPNKFRFKIPKTLLLYLYFQVKVVVTLSGDVISHADINLKLPRPAVGKDLYSNTSIREDAPWQLQQVQDSVNHLR